MENRKDSSSSSGSMVSNAFGHFRTITKHKMTVMKLCFRAGLIKQGLLHDLSKYTPLEFKSGVIYYQGDRSPNAIEKKEKGYSEAWLHHKGRNKHHFEYWFDLSYTTGEGVKGAKMPMKYVLEMACDRIAACKTYHGDAYKDGDAYEYWLGRYDRVAPAMHEDTAELLAKILKKLSDEGEDACIEYMRWLQKHPEVY